MRPERVLWLCLLVCAASVSEGRDPPAASTTAAACWAIWAACWPLPGAGGTWAGSGCVGPCCAGGGCCTAVVEAVGGGSRPTLTEATQANKHTQSSLLSRAAPNFPAGRIDPLNLAALRAGAEMIFI